MTLRGILIALIGGVFLINTASAQHKAKKKTNTKSKATAHSTKHRAGRVKGKRGRVAVVHGTPITADLSSLVRSGALRSAQLGVCIMDAETGEYLYNYQGDKFFVPASNTKLFSCYAAMKYLSDSLVGVRYELTRDTVFIQAAGDPTFMHGDFSRQPVMAWLKALNRPVVIDANNWEEEGWGRGWSWNDYQKDYMAERSPLPMYGNMVSFSLGVITPGSRKKRGTYRVNTYPAYFERMFASSYHTAGMSISRPMDSNRFIAHSGRGRLGGSLPFKTHGLEISVALLQSALQVPVRTTTQPHNYDAVLYSQPTDTMLALMMHRSDNFFAEQSLLMVSNEKLGVMNDREIIDTLLSNDLRGLPQRPKWIDGSGLSHDNLITPQDFVWLLRKMHQEGRLERLKVLLPTGGTGTLRNFYHEDRGYIFAKTGTLSSCASLSGYLITQQGKLLYFSLIANNLAQGAGPARSAYQQFLHAVRQKY